MVIKVMKINLDSPQKIHFIGIGGISMSAIAELLHSKGFTVSGSDDKKSRHTEHLEALGVEIIASFCVKRSPSGAVKIISSYLR